MGRLTEYFGRQQRPSTRSLYGLPEYAQRTIRRVRSMKVDPARVAEQDARTTFAKRPGPLEADWTPEGLTPRQVAAAKAVQALMRMKSEGETPQLTRKFDAACRVIDDSDGDLGPIIRDVVFGPEPDYSEPVRPLAELTGSTLEMSFET